MPAEDLIDQAVDAFRECTEADPGSIEEAEFAEQFNVLIDEYLAANEHLGGGLGAVARAIAEACDLSYREAYKQVQFVRSYGAEPAEDEELDGVEDDYESGFEEEAYGYDDYDDDGEPISRYDDEQEEEY